MGAGEAVRWRFDWIWKTIHREGEEVEEVVAMTNAQPFLVELGAQMASWKVVDNDSFLISFQIDYFFKIWKQGLSDHFAITWF